MVLNMWEMGQEPPVAVVLALHGKVEGTVHYPSDGCDRLRGWDLILPGGNALCARNCLNPIGL